MGCSRVQQVDARKRRQRLSANKNNPRWHSLYQQNAVPQSSECHTIPETLVEQWAFAGLRAVGILYMMGKSAPQLIFPPSYGEPLDLADLEDGYHSAIESDDNQKARAVVAELTTRIAKELSRLSINAPNWYALVAQVCLSDLHIYFLGMSFILPRLLDACCGQTGIFLSKTSPQSPARRPMYCIP